MDQSRFNSSGSHPDGLVSSVDYKGLTYYYDDVKDLYANVDDTTYYIDTDGNVKKYDGDGIVANVNLKGSIFTQAWSFLSSEDTINKIESLVIPPSKTVVQPGNTNNINKTVATSNTTTYMVIGLLVLSAIGVWVYTKKHKKAA